MPASIVPSLWKKGTIVYFRKFQFIDQSKAKYAVLMEDWENNRNTIVFLLTTSNMRFKDKKWTAIIPTGTVSGLSGDSLVDCNNWWEFPKNELEKQQYVSQLPQEIIHKIDKSLTYAKKIPLEIIIRLRGIQI